MVVEAVADVVEKETIDGVACVSSSWRNDAVHRVNVKEFVPDEEDTLRIDVNALL